MAWSTLGTGFGSVCMAPLITLLVDQYNYFGTMLVVGALLFNNSVGGSLYRTPPATPPQRHAAIGNPDADEPELETGQPGNVISVHKLRTLKKWRKM